jgi:hypothetical protein
MRKFVMANGILNVGQEIVDWEQDDYTHADLLKELGVHEFGADGQGYGVIENEIARIDVDCDGLEESLGDFGFEVRRIRLVNVKDEVRDDEGERDSDDE